MEKTREKIRVVVYCRVSTDSESQLNSLQSQEKYYRRLFENNSDYELIKVYIDIGSGLNTKNRCAYKQMVKDSSKGKFDLIFVKSLSRLGRNIELILLQIMKWKEMKIGVYSEIENINTLNAQDSMIGIYLAIAQEQSCAKSENIKFGIQQRMKTGKAILNHSQFLGYTKGEDGVLIIVPEEAEIVRKIYDLYLQGNGVRKIKKYLEENNIKTVTGKTIWSTSTIDRILSNEKYIGQVLMQKTYTPNYLTGKQKKNKGELSMYLVENAHEAIIDKDIFDKVQKMKSKHKK